MRTQHAELLREHDKDARLIVRSATPLNVETPLSLLDCAITPTPLFFIRNNDTIPDIRPDDWRLHIDGLVERPLTLDWERLRSLPSTRCVAVLQCAGNGRARFAETGPPAEGVPWENGAIGNAEWEGVSVRTILEQAGVRAGALQAECVGGDADGTTRGVEVAKLLDDAMLAWSMNGEPLPRVHGGPVRLVVPGWGGINWIKWIVRMRLIAGESQSRYNQEKYVLVDAAGNQVGKVREFGINSLITRIEPAAVATHAGNGTDGTSETRGPGAAGVTGGTVVHGVAWSPIGVTAVELCVDGGAWQPARLLADLGRHAWRQWQWSWDASPGEHVLAVRASDARGPQPEQVSWNLHGYLMNAIQRVRVRTG